MHIISDWNDLDIQSSQIKDKRDDFYHIFSATKLKMVKLSFLQVLLRINYRIACL